MSSIARLRIAAALVALSATGCRTLTSSATPPVPTLGAMPFPVDSEVTQQIADGVTRRYIRTPKGPWTMNVLYVDLDRCNAVQAVKGGDSAAGRYRVSETLAELAKHERVIGGVNGDFFELKDGTPTNLLIVNGRLVTPPNYRPVLAFDSAGAPHISTFRFAHGSLEPFYPKNAVGGRPVIVTDSALDAAADTAGPKGFAAPNPRTGAGIARNGRRLIFVAVDGREYHNAGMTLRELGDVMLALGARDAINLDGGGSTTMVVADPDSAGRLHIVNHPSDKGGERTVGDALAIVHACGRAKH